MKDLGVDNLGGELKTLCSAPVHPVESFWLTIHCGLTCAQTGPVSTNMDSRRFAKRFQQPSDTHSI
jgi:hypothetical protein